MKTSTLPLIFAALGLAASPTALFAQAPTETVRPHAGMLRYPSVSATEVAFLYAGKLWRAPRTGGVATPVALPASNGSRPKFSADGKTIAFMANYDGNVDLYTIPTEGGTPSRVTYHPSPEVLYGWTPDGRLLFSNRALQGVQRNATLLTVAPSGGLPTALPVPYGEDAALSPDGKTLAYTPSSTNDRTWKRYRGGWAQDIWLFDLEKRTSKKITDWEGTDTLPMWAGTTLYYLSDGGPEHKLNLWAYDTVSGKRRQVTKFSDYDLKWPSIGPDAIVFQHGADLMLLDLKTETAKTVEIRIPGDKLGVRPKTVDTAGRVESVGISPNAKRVVVAARGDLWTLPAKEGIPHNLTRTNGAHERDPSWSPDGTTIAYLSDVTGEWEVYLTPADGKGAAKQLVTAGEGHKYLLGWSPDGKYLLFADKTGALFTHTLASGKTTKIDKNPMGGNFGASFSADSRYLTYAYQLDFKQPSVIFIYDLTTGTKHQVTSGMFSDTSPVFDRKGEYLYYTSSRVFGAPTYDENQTSWVYTNTGTIVAVPLRSDVASPFLPKNDDEVPAEKPKAALVSAELVTSAILQDNGVSGKWTGTISGTPLGDLPFVLTLQLASDGALTGSLEVKGVGAAPISGRYNAADKTFSFAATLAGTSGTVTGKIDGGKLTGGTSDFGAPVSFSGTREQASPAVVPGAAGASKPGPAVAAKAFTIELEGFEARGFQLPIKPGSFGALGVNAQNQLLFVRTAGEGAPPGIKAFDLSTPKSDERLVAAGGSFDITPDGKKLLVPMGSGAVIVDAAGGAPEPVPTTGMSVTIDPKVEWREIFEEAWRIMRDFFYDPTMHGVDWKAVHTQYAKMLPDVNSRADLAFVISEMISELNVGHAYYQGGPDDSGGATAANVSVGMLGCDFVLEKGAYKIAKIYRGGAWDTDAVGPLTTAKVKEGEYLLAVNGQPLDPTKDPLAALQGMAGQVTQLTVSSKPSLDKDAREVLVRPLASDSNLRYRAWIERNRQYVSEKTGGKVGYIYVPDTGVNGQTDLFRQFVGQLGKEALIIDERWNGGGQIPTRFVELLNRPTTNFWALRDGQDWAWPPDAHSGPKCMLINGLAGSGGDAFPYYFRQAGLGKLIGTRTWGGLVGISGAPAFLDGASITAPNFAFYETDGTWGIEGHGVDPDIEVLDDPAKMQNGADPQLDAGIAQMLSELAKRPKLTPKRPTYPNRAGMGIKKEDR